MVDVSNQHGRISQNHKRLNTPNNQMSNPMIRNDTILEGSQPPSRAPPTDQLFRRFTPDQVTQYPTSDISNRSLTSVNVFTVDPDIKRAHTQRKKREGEFIRTPLSGSHVGHIKMRVRKLHELHELHARPALRGRSRFVSL